MKILAISNGHGEDIIAISIIKKLMTYSEVSQIVALPLVGEGHAFKQNQIPIIGKVSVMPSGGFNQQTSELLRDVNKGLINLTYQQYQVIYQWGKKDGVILAVGDILPLFFAWLSNTNFVFIGVAKSEYYVRDEKGWLSSTLKVNRCFKSIYYPWERWLMKSAKCKGVFVRDTLTAVNLNKLKISAHFLGNPMMDDFSDAKQTYRNIHLDKIKILLLPGSRTPETLRNWTLILQSVQTILESFPKKSFLFLSAIAPSLNCIPFRQELIKHNWKSQILDRSYINFKDSQALQFQKENATLILTQFAYNECLQLSNLGIAMAGTATEQFVGLGKPVISFPGEGPQFTRQFAEKQTCLLGPSVILTEKPKDISEALRKLLSDKELINNLNKNGKKRMGKPGASRKIAECLVNQCFNSLD
ncbi:lipid-A-disaccharide synthase-related protein [Candidatus Atelocyanobacterium thalassae]|uniref:Lipid-A-disaccharide synthase n=1 Tax=cyanobacterium endosymbiont of Braarudosphaera bigelowii TaxID=1285375 RepID=A0ABM7U4X3_9CHRO|nr:lipid-A-disaccharide synthase-related protein [Candidatus Atelocyanobacterium thalassa]BDA39664.1 hypothetical protein CPARK_000050300 [cyanobacterium endosymbiont of Braarudosphaera bigelowii]